MYVIQELPLAEGVTVALAVVGPVGCAASTGVLHIGLERKQVEGYNEANVNWFSFKEAFHVPCLGH